MNIKDNLTQNNFHFSKRFGQNFITDGNLLSAIVADAGVTPADTVLEIGTGAGTLTSALATVAHRVVSYEIDKSLQPVLAQTLADYPNVQVVFGDFMQQAPALLARDFANAKVVANLPYYVTTPILLRLLEYGIGKDITVMVQQEVAQRLVAAPGTKDYSSISVKLQLLGTVSITRTVGRHMFYPPPNVDSAVVHFVRCPSLFPDDHPTLTNRVVRCAFAMRRKTLVNNLVMGLGITREVALQALTQMGLAPDVRGETLSPAQFIRLAGTLHDLGLPTD